MTLIPVHSVCLALAAAGYGVPPNATAQDSPQFYPSQLNLSAPSVAALDILGISASKASPATNLLDISASLVNSFDSGGLLKNGFAINGLIGQIKPFSASNSATMFSDPGERILRFTNLSMAAVKGAGNGDTSGRMAFSVSIPLIDQTDWRFVEKSRNAWADLAENFLNNFPELSDLPSNSYPVNIAKAESANVQVWINKLNDPKVTFSPGKRAGWIATFNAAAKELGAVNTLPNVENIDLFNDDQRAVWDRILSTYQKAIKDARLDQEIKDAVLDLDAFTAQFNKYVKEFNDSHWNAMKLDLSFAYALFANDASKDALKGEGTYITAAYAMPFGENGQLTLYGKVASKDRVWDKDTTTWNLSNTQSVGGRFKFGDTDSGLFIEYLSTRKSVGGGATSTDQIFQGGFETKIGEGQWLQIAIGGGDGMYSKTLLGLNFAFNLSPTRQIEVKKKS